MLTALLLSAVSWTEVACFHCHCVPSSAGRVNVRVAHSGHKDITVRDANAQSSSVSVPNSSSSSITGGNVTVTPKPGETWGTVSGCGDITLVCN